MRLSRYAIIEDSERRFKLAVSVFPFSYASAAAHEVTLKAPDQTRLQLAQRRSAMHSLQRSKCAEY
jgi:hypothetical protein